MSALSKMFTLAEEWGLKPDGTNPCRHVKKYKEKPRERYLTTEESQRLGRVLNEAKGTEDPFMLAAIWLLILTGARFSEIRTLKWDYVDFDHSLLRLPDSKSGAKPIYLGAHAVTLLKNIPRIGNNPFVILGRMQGQPASHGFIHETWDKIRLKANITDVRIHDLRHSFASTAVSNGMSLHMLGKLLGHRKAETTMRYAHLAADPMKNASDLVGNEIAALMGPKP